MRKILAAFFLIIATSLASAQSGPAVNFAPAVPQTYTAVISPGYNLTYNGTTQFLAMPGGISGYASGSLTVSWTTSVTCESQINYGATANYGQSVSSSILETSAERSHDESGVVKPTDGSTIHYSDHLPQFDWRPRSNRRFCGLDLRPNDAGLFDLCRRPHRDGQRESW